MTGREKRAAWAAEGKRVGDPPAPPLLRLAVLLREVAALVDDLGADDLEAIHRCIGRDLERAWFTAGASGGRFALLGVSAEIGARCGAVPLDVRARVGWGSWKPWIANPEPTPGVDAWAREIGWDARELAGVVGRWTSPPEKPGGQSEPGERRPVFGYVCGDCNGSGCVNCI